MKSVKLLELLVVASLLLPVGSATAAAGKPTKGTPSAVKATPQRAEITVTSDGFVPASIKVKVGKPVTLVVTRKVERTCATEIVIKDYAINTPLPLNVPVEVTLTPKKAGGIRFACGMDMIAGELVAE